MSEISVDNPLRFASRRIGPAFLASGLSRSPSHTRPGCRVLPRTPSLTTCIFLTEWVSCNQYAFRWKSSTYTTAQGTPSANCDYIPCKCDTKTNRLFYWIDSKTPSAIKALLPLSFRRSRGHFQSECILVVEFIAPPGLLPFCLTTGPSATGSQIGISTCRYSNRPCLAVVLKDFQVQLSMGDIEGCL